MLLPDHGHLSILRSKTVCDYVSDCLHEITQRPISVPLDANLSVNSAYHEVDAEIIAFKNRVHVGNTKKKLQVLIDLRTLLGDKRDGNRHDHFPEAQSVSELIQLYLQTPDPKTNVPPSHHLKSKLNPSVTLFKTSPSTSQLFIDGLIASYQNVPLPVMENSIWIHNEAHQLAPHASVMR